MQQHGSQETMIDSPWHTPSNKSQSRTQIKQHITIHATTRPTIHDPNQATVDNPCNNKKHDRTNAWRTTSNKSKSMKSSKKSVRKHMHTKQTKAFHLRKMFARNCYNCFSLTIKPGMYCFCNFYNCFNRTYKFNESSYRTVV